MNVAVRGLFFAAASASLVFVAGAQAQDWGLNPAYGEVSLSGGFTPDPHTLNLQAGGSNAASALGGNCAGYIADAPDYRLRFNQPAGLPLIISVNAQSDTTLVVNGPDGRWHCDDDSGEGLNPSLRFDNPQGGQYDIWVGVYGGTSLQPAALQISEIYSH